MAEPKPGGDALAAAEAASDAVKRSEPATPIKQRARAHQLIMAQRELLNASRRITEAKATASVNGNGHANGHSNGHARDMISDAEVTALAKGLVGWLGPILKD